MVVIRFILSLAIAYLLAVLVLTFTYLVMPPVSTVMVASAVRGEGMARTWVPLEKISPHVLRAVIAAEDGRFCSHRGIDWQAVDKAMMQAKQSGRAPRGASTVTMQVAKNLFFFTGRSWLRKALEAPIALWIDLLWSKRRIMEVYLNIAEWGDGVFGIEAAAKHEFGVSANDLSASQAALLAIMLPDPERRSARHPGPRHRAMAAQLRARMGREGANTRCVGR